uniref:Uncharacterized protein n=1 Tax=Ixodes scapularis TaxID=6945 RepID=A0A4D5S121_IXOSC
MSIWAVHGISWVTSVTTHSIFADFIGGTMTSCSMVYSSDSVWTCPAVLVRLTLVLNVLVTSATPGRPTLMESEVPTLNESCVCHEYWCVSFLVRFTVTMSGSVGIALWDHSVCTTLGRTGDLLMLPYFKEPTVVLTLYFLYFAANSIR